MHNHSPDCDVNDRNPDGIAKPCNCGAMTVLWCPECDGKQPHRVSGYVAECTVCLEPHEINPVTLQPI